MGLVIVQGMACLGKSSLCRKLKDDLPDCEVVSVDKYKEMLWDKFGFDSVKERDLLSVCARIIAYCNVNAVIKDKKWVLFEYPFTPYLWKELNLWCIQDLEKAPKTIYLRPVNLLKHKLVWERRSRDFSVRHPGHGATWYHDGEGGDYVNRYDSKVFESMPTTQRCLSIDVDFEPYSLSIPYEEILQFVKED